MQALMDGVVLAVHRQNGDAAALRGLRDDPAGHDQNFLVGERDRLAQLDGGQDRFEAIGTRRRAQDEIGVGVRRDRDQSIPARSRHRRARRTRSRPADRPPCWCPWPRRRAGTARSVRRRAPRSRQPPGRRPAIDRDGRPQLTARSARLSRSIRGWRCASRLVSNHRGHKGHRGKTIHLTKADQKFLRVLCVLGGVRS